MPGVVRAAVSIAGLLLAGIGVFFIIRDMRHAAGDDKRPPAKMKALGLELEVNPPIALVVIGVIFAAGVWLLPSSEREGEANAGLESASTPPPTSGESSPVESPSSVESSGDLTVRVLESSFRREQDLVSPRNGPEIVPDDVSDLSVLVELGGGPTGVIATICEDDDKHELTQWDTYEGTPPNDGRFEPHGLDTFQLAVRGSAGVMNPGVGLEGPLPDDQYELFMSLADHATPPTEGDNLCVTAVRSNNGEDTFKTVLAPIDYDE